MSTSSFANRLLTGVACAAALCASSTVLAAGKAAPGPFSQASTGSQFGAVHGAPNANASVTSSLVINLTGLTSYDGVDEPINTVLTLDALAGGTVDAISWNVSLATIGDSWLSEATVLITNTAGDGVVFSPGFGDDFSGTGTYADSASLLSLGLSFNVLADGKLVVQFYEEYDDNPGAADALYTAGNITFGAIGVAAAVPEPATYGLMAMGLLGVAAAARRRRRAD